MGRVGHSPYAHSLQKSKLLASIGKVKASTCRVANPFCHMNLSGMGQLLLILLVWELGPFLPSLQETCRGVSSQLFRTSDRGSWRKERRKEKIRGCFFVVVVKTRGRRSPKEAVGSCNHSICRNDVEPLPVNLEQHSVCPQLLWKNVSSWREESDVCPGTGQALNGYICQITCDLNIS